MRRAIRFSIGGVLVCLVTALVITQSSLGQGGSNEVCPYLRTDAQGFPLDPPYSEYPTPTTGQVFIPGLTIFDPNAPCCGDSTTTTTSSTDSASGITTVTITTTFALSGTPAQATVDNNGNLQSFCQPPDFDLITPPSSTTRAQNGNVVTVTIVDNPFAGRTCPADVDVDFTFEAQGGAVRNCIPPSAVLPDTGGGSNFVLLTGTNAN